MNSKVKSSMLDPEYYLTKHSSPNKNSFSPHRITPQEVIETCASTAKKTSSDHFGISQKLVIDNINTLSPVVAHIWNQSIGGNGVFPTGCNVAKVVPIYKGKNLDAAQYTNYRPISLLSIVGKILERIMYDQLVQFLSKHSICQKTIRKA